MADESTDFGREEELFREAFARHADDLSDEPVGFLPPASRSRRMPPQVVRWLAVAAAASVAVGGGWAYLYGPDQAVPGPAAHSALPSSPSPIPSPSASSASPTPTHSPSRPSASPSPTTSRIVAVSPRPATSTSPTTQTTAVSTPAATSTAQSGGRPSVRATGAPTTVDTPMDENELGDYNPNDPVPAKADQLTIDTPVTVNGWGAYRLGMSEQELKDRKLVVPSTTRCEGSLEAITVHKTLGLHQVDSNSTGGLWGIEISNPVVKTDRGAMVGMTLAQVQRLHGAAFAYETKTAEGGAGLPMGRVRQGGREIIFVTQDASGNYTAATPDARVTAMIVRDYGKWQPVGAGC